MSKKSRLGINTGLATLFSDYGEIAQINQEEKILQLDVLKVDKNPFQPRLVFDDESINELASSIKEYGVLQPIIVRENQDRYEIVAGERRLRASKLAGNKKIPAVVIKASDEETALFAIVENLQRTDLDIIEEAKAFLQLETKFDFTQENIAKAVGRARSTIANALRLLRLPEKIQQMLSLKQIDIGHAKILLGIDSKEDQIMFADEVVKYKLTVKQLIALIASQHKSKPAERLQNGDILEFQNKLSNIFGCEVKINHSEKTGKGKMIVNYESTKDLHSLLKKMM